MKRTVTLDQADLCAAVRLWLLDVGYQPDEEVSFRLCVDNVTAWPHPRSPVRLRVEVEVEVSEPGPPSPKEAA